MQHSCPFAARGQLALLLLLVALGCALSATAQQQLAPATPLAIGQTFTLASRVLGETRRINVYMPPGPPDSARAALPVLYMPDGGMAEDFLHVAGLVQVLVGNGTMRPFLLVGIENTERRRDLTGPTTDPQDRKIAPRVGGSAAFRQFLRQELMPEVAKRYRVTTEKAIIGESLAGLFVVETLLAEPDLFDTYLAFDPSLWWNKERLLQTAPDFARQYKGPPKVLYMAASSQPDIARATRELGVILQQAANPRLTVMALSLPLETHQTIYHPAALLGLRAVFSPSLSKK
ncbi:alpha/beta hydrolase [Hymenobacter lapidiphilus]|uniref:alpha/beta hydrolase n=1 Tax=Hymenobacter sp. CCM 8763 TaxID=2303334 RepID=UPI000E347C67|nr:alpha/beta hydrolase-fold protein [Hymenobacter sp. CCM 8763]RFP66439.1 alpha/beta hydrolase [Hymenobacter sp. CCM 8763]